MKAEQEYLQVRITTFNFLILECASRRDQISWVRNSCTMHEHLKVRENKHFSGGKSLFWFTSMIFYHLLLINRDLVFL